MIKLWGKLNNSMCNVHNVCRICLCLNATVSLFDVEADSPSLSSRLVDKMLMCVDVVVLPSEEGLPRALCEGCSLRLDDAFLLRQLAQRTNKELRERLMGMDCGFQQNTNKELKPWNIENQSKSFGNENNYDIDDKIKSEDDALFSREEIKIELNDEPLCEKLKKCRKSDSVKKKTEMKIQCKLKSKIKRSRGEQCKRLKRKSNKQLSNIVVMNSKDYINNLQCYNNEEYRLLSDHKHNFSVIENNCLNGDETSLLDKTEDKTAKPLHCAICNVTFKHTNSFRRHMRVEHRLQGFDRAKDHMCDACGNTFHDRYGLQMHKRSHTGDRPFTCSICGQGFTQQSNMERHISAKHKKDKPYQCEICSKHFAYSSSLRDHKQRHTGLQNYECSICNRKFARNYTLVRHQLTHTQARPYICKYCNKSYTQSNDLKTHVKKTHPEHPADKLSDYCVKEVIKIS